MRSIAHKEDWEKKQRTMNYTVFMNSKVLDILEPTWTVTNFGQHSCLLFFCKKKYGFSYFLQPFLTRVLEGYDQFDTTKWNDFFPKICQFQLSYCPYSIPDNWEVKVMKYQRVTLDIPLDELEKNLSVNIRRILKKKDLFSVRKNIPLPEYFDFLLKHNKYFSKMNTELFLKFKKLIEYFDSSGLGEVLAISDDSHNCLAMSFFVFDTQSVIEFKGGVSEEGRKKGAMIILHLNALSKYHGRFKFYDFYGANSSKRENLNLKFGSKNIEYFQFTRIDYPQPLKYLIRKVGSL
ncbi:MAG: hypothetical protein FJY17_04545 [Bacteroidetes bacterium]|nr:hypothetical protein [Bacteroidota bacterium]